MKQPTKDCATCGKTFPKPPTCSMKEWREQRKYCSRQCYWEVKRKVYACHGCGRKFNRQSYGAGQPKYCSKKCRVDARRKPLPLCEWCGDECPKHGRRFCSRGCKVEWYRGKNVYNYVGEDFRKDACPVDYTWWFKRAKEIRERDRVCQHCGMTPEENGRALDVHHITPYRVSQDNSHSNLVALCRSCHAKADNEYDANHN